MKYLDTIQLSVLWFPLVFVVMLPLVWWSEHRRFGELHEYRAATKYAFAFALFTAALLTTLPLPEDSAAFCARREASDSLRFVPFAAIAGAFEEATWRGFGPAALLKNGALWQVVLNFLMLMPVGFFLRALWGMKLWEALLGGFAVSLFFELSQLTGVWGLADCPYRLFDFDDLWLNALGAGAGWGLMGLPPFSRLPSPRLHERHLWYGRKRKDRND